MQGLQTSMGSWPSHSGVNTVMPHRGRQEWNAVLNPDQGKQPDILNSTWLASAAAYDGGYAWVERLNPTPHSQQLKASSKHKAGAVLSLWWEPFYTPPGSMVGGQIAFGPLK